MWLTFVLALGASSLVWAILVRRRQLRRLNDIRSSVEDLTRQRRWDEALRQLDSADLEFPSNADLRSLHERVQEGRREDVARRVIEIEEAMAAGHLDRAQHISRDIEQSGLPDPELSQLRTKLHDLLLRRDDVSRSLRDIEAMTAAGDQRGALELLSSALQRFPTESRFRELEAALRERHQQIASALDRARSLLHNGRFKEAYQFLREVSETTRDTRVFELLRDAESAIDDGRLQELFVEARRRWEHGDAGQAESMLRHIVAEAQHESLRRISAEFLEFIHHERHHREFVSRTLERSERLAADGQFEDALRELERASGQIDHPLLRWNANRIAKALQEAKRRLDTDPSAVPPDVQIDNVHFTLTGPSVLPRARASEIQFWVHVDSQRGAVIESAKESLRPRESDPSVKSEGPFPVPRGARISVWLSIDGLRCLERHKWITWTGEIGRTTFVVDVPPDATEGTHHGIASIRLNGFQIAKMSFVVLVGVPKLESTVLPSETAQHRDAFASYSSEDRCEVLARVQGMEAAYKGLKVFVDVIGLRSAQYWETELSQRISAADIFYLFWCRHAKDSEWVAKEWRWALETKGLNFIDPVPLEGPEFAPPPHELAAKHFNDPLLAFIVAAGGGHSTR